MDFVFRRTYRGPLKAAIFDWAGTTVDYGCCAPAGVFAEVFHRRGIEVTQEQARGPMGMHKRDHILTMSKMPEIAKKWEDVHGQPCEESDIDSMFDEFVPMQLACLPNYNELTPGTLIAQEDLRKRGMKIGSTTGYNREMLDFILGDAKKQGYAPDTGVSAAEVSAGRPAPWMVFKVAEQLGVYPMEAYVKVGDTVSDIGEGLNAGMWTVGITKAGNEVGLSKSEVDSMDPEQLAVRIERAENRLLAAGAHFIIKTMEEVPSILDEINRRLAAGERP
ncbi:MAG: phosphonoacetaldehyde hydrolase [Candidatus Omnitrophica bacterium]|nr:phosphonoacetaldehyde hydrolase [Candidatus Omnitrophota bacterium]